MKPPLRNTPLELPRQALYEKHYSAVLCGDGRIMPIEERLGRRLLRTIDPESVEGRDLLRRGWVSLKTLGGKSLDGSSLQRVYTRLREEAESMLDKRPRDARWRRHYESMISNIERWEQALLRAPLDH